METKAVQGNGDSASVPSLVGADVELAERLSEGKFRHEAIDGKARTGPATASGVQLWLECSLSDRKVGRGRASGYVRIARSVNCNGESLVTAKTAEVTGIDEGITRGGEFRHEGVTGERRHVT